MEYVGYMPRTAHATIHCGAYNHIKKTQKGTTTEFNDNDYNLFQLDWKPNSITILINNRAYFKFDKESSNYDVWPFDNEFNIILNTAVGKLITSYAHFFKISTGNFHFWLLIF